jgi:hypothetical protein
MTSIENDRNSESSQSVWGAAKFVALTHVDHVLNPPSAVAVTRQPPTAITKTQQRDMTIVKPRGSPETEGFRTESPAEQITP